jgi:hypothetical protein
MAWKDLQTWLKGGIIGFVLSTLIFIGYFLGAHPCDLAINKSCFFIWGVDRVFNDPSGISQGMWLYFYLIFVVPCLIVGSIVGLIIGKIKSKQ